MGAGRHAHGARGAQPARRVRPGPGHGPGPAHGHSCERFRPGCRGLGDGGAVELSLSLPRARALARLDLGSNGVGAEGAAALAEAGPEFAPCRLSLVLRVPPPPGRAGPRVFVRSCVAPARGCPPPPQKAPPESSSRPTARGGLSAGRGGARRSATQWAPTARRRSPRRSPPPQPGRARRGALLLLRAAPRAPRAPRRTRRAGSGALI